MKLLIRDERKSLSERPHKCTIIYEASFDRCDREKNIEIVWDELEKRFGTTKH